MGRKQETVKELMKVFYMQISMGLWKFPRILAGVCEIFTGVARLCARTHWASSTCVCERVRVGCVFCGVWMYIWGRSIGVGMWIWSWALADTHVTYFPKDLKNPIVKKKLELSASEEAMRLTVSDLTAQRGLTINWWNISVRSAHH